MINIEVLELAYRSSDLFSQQYKFISIFFPNLLILFILTNNNYKRRFSYIYSIFNFTLLKLFICWYQGVNVKLRNSIYLKFINIKHKTSNLRSCIKPEWNIKIEPWCWIFIHLRHFLRLRLRLFLYLLIFYLVRKLAKLLEWRVRKWVLLMNYFAFSLENSSLVFKLANNHFGSGVVYIQHLGGFVYWNFMFQHHFDQIFSCLNNYEKYFVTNGVIFLFSIRFVDCLYVIYLFHSKIWV